MVNKTTSFKKKGKGKERGTSKKNSKQVTAPMKKLKARPKPGTECFYCKGNGHWKWNCPRYLADKKDGKVNKIIYLIYMLLMCTLLVFITTPQYLILVQLLRLVTRNGSCRINRD